VVSIIELQQHEHHTLVQHTMAWKVRHAERAALQGWLGKGSFPGWVEAQTLTRVHHSQVKVFIVTFKHLMVEEVLVATTPHTHVRPADADVRA